MNVSEDVLKLVNPKTFDEVYYRYIAETGLPDRMIFDVLNELYERTYGVKRYSNFDSYRAARNRRLRSANIVS